MTKRLDAIRQRLEVMQAMAQIPDDITEEGNVSIGDWYAHDVAHLLSLVEKQTDALISIEEYWNGAEESAVNAAEEMRYRAQQALKCDEGGEVGE